jgi:phospholipid transport system transporter-binding protein
VCTSRFGTEHLHSQWTADDNWPRTCPETQVSSGMKQQIVVDTSMHTPRSANAVPSMALPADCTIRAIGALHSCLRRVSAAAVLDGSAVQRIDKAGVQLLVAFIRERRAAHTAVGWSAASPALLEAARSLGLTKAMKIPTV